MHDTLFDLIKNAHNILIFTGAGVSTQSGIPDFRGPQGIWKNRNPIYYQEFMSFEESRIDYWQFKLDGWQEFQSARPNSIHQAIVKLEKMGKLCCVVTQNIDGLHRMAGTTEEKLIELHGTNSFVECQTCHETSDPQPHFDYFTRTGKPPCCPCGGYLKHATISFGQNLREKDLDSAVDKAHKADMVIALGSTLSVYPAAEIPRITARNGNPYVIINRGETDHDLFEFLTKKIDDDIASVFATVMDKF
ncbi:SIR2 family NAD-dependent protein deacylase [Candidatus Uabimicrobium amorphum]|uniref:protein acetyllysine N-acetyltransferase n=1 Tax=Uabimicrobium amorphum TaxID=2596890 RepID=A0A5S9IS06_UABAM|nr:Sir2 family NAD-dependent protein deacetylase [Candidatus Uabimicrobium amorphum]BBM86470.1 NAD-dependent protein deacetylase 1 [Candidatus Uabimicrobium amorphum]